MKTTFTKKRTFESRWWQSGTPHWILHTQKNWKCLAACFWALQKDISDSEISCKNGYSACERRCFSCVPVSGLLPDAGWQVTVLLLLSEDWDQLFLLLGHQGGSDTVEPPRIEPFSAENHAILNYLVKNYIILTENYVIVDYFNVILE